MPRHAERRRLPYGSEQMFDLVADVERYPDFLPWCEALRIRGRLGGGTELVADMTIGFKALRETFTTRVSLQRPARIDVKYEQGPFKYLKNRWDFEADGEGRCTIDFEVDFQFRSRLLELAVGPVFGEATRRMVQAFEKRARMLYGPRP
ncbi:MAG: type II toxin-antitoxin system RatA family toxin [Magnetospirillum sp. WYHS-4]